MANKKNIDEKISRIVRSIESDIPASVEEKLLATAETIRPFQRIRLKPLQSSKESLDDVKELTNHNPEISFILFYIGINS